jgi:glycosyltransferase involved in cell wall biosynthesis
MSDTIRPLHIVHFIAGLQASGAEVALTRLVQQASRADLKHTVISLTDRGVLATTITEAGGDVMTLELAPNLSLLRGAAKACQLLPALRPDVVQGWMIHGNLAAWAARALFFPRARLAWNLRMSLKNAVHESRRTLGMTRLAARFSSSVDLLISNSISGLEDHRALGYASRAEVVIPNGFDLDLFKPDDRARARLRQELGVSDGDVVLGLVGRYHPAKGHSVLIEAADLARHHPGLVFVLIGRGADAHNAELVQELERRNLSERFRLLGERDDVHAVLNALDIVCMPSLYEGFPNALGEAMTAGRLCIASDISDVRAILDGHGRLVPAGDAGALAEAIVDAAALTPAERAASGDAARDSIRQRYTLEAVAATYVASYRDMITGRGRSR